MKAPLIQYPLRCVAILALAGSLTGCATNSIKRTWKSPDFQQPVGKVAALAVDDRGLVRQGFENRFVTYLGQGGTRGVVTFDQLSLPEIKENKQAAAERFRGLGADAVLILRLVDAATSYHESQPGGERYAATITGIGYAGWYDYYTVGFVNMSPTYGSSKTKLTLECALFDLKTEKRIWSALSQSVVKDNMDRVAEMDPIVQMFLAEMRKEGVVR
jgi:hypothetical protein